MSEVRTTTWTDEILAAIDYDGDGYVELQEARVFAVPGKDQPLYYVLYFTDVKAWACTCKDFRYRGVVGHFCKHMSMVKRRLDRTA